jgi:LmbE family N-acetylglucosaminyl deacetylase
VFTLKNKRILILSPHPDDEVFGCGGLIARAKDEGSEIYVLYFTIGTTKDFSKKGETTYEARLKELKAATKMLGLNGYRIALPEDCHLRLDTVPQRTLINEIERGEKISLEALKPDILLLPIEDDYNQDHRAIYEAAITATRPSSKKHKHFQPIVLTYELPYATWGINTTQLPPNVYIELSKDDLGRKIDALKCYKSQLKANDAPLSVHGVKSLATLRGVQCGSLYAEAYTAKRIAF